MSGPKSSNYMLSQERLRQIAEQQRREREAEEERRRVEAARSRKAELCKSLTSSLTALAGRLERLTVLQQESGWEAPQLASGRKEMQAIELQLASLQKRTAAVSKDIQSQNKQLSTLLRHAAELYDDCSRQTETFAQRFHQHLQASIEQGLGLSFANLTAAPKAEQQQMIRQIQKEIAELAGLPLSETLQQHLTQIKQKADEISDPEYLGTFRAVVIAPLIKQCREYAELCEEHDSLLIRYAVLAAECHMELEAVPYTREALEELKQKISFMETQSLAQREKEAIREALDDAMREMGYELAGDRVVAKRSGKKIRHALYTLDNGTGVDVTYGENGQISMELGGLDERDRSPDSAESGQLVEDMQAFCADYTLLMKKLAERGIRTEKITEHPPKVDFAQIFNTKDYNIGKPVRHYYLRSRKKQENQILKREG